MKHRIASFIALPAIILSIYPVVIPGEELSRSVRAERVDEPPVIDGRLDDACWQRAHPTSGFTAYRTEQTAVEQTIVRLLYDDENVYVAFECLEPDPNRIVAMERKYDQSLKEEDRVEVRLDTFLDRRCAYIFAANTLGTRFDARIGLFGYEDSWGCDWTVACTIEQDRWFAEFCIPIGNMLFARKDGASWGVNFRRNEQGIPESSYWNFPNSQASYPRHYGVLTNLNLSRVKVGEKPAFETYVSGSSDFRDNSNKGSTGLDTSMRLNSELVSAFTINPDFGQVEADPDTIELRDTERFLREKRTFFREGSELFDTPLNIYYSRRLSDIDVGAKVTGQSKNWALGVLDVEGQIVRDDVARQGNYSVGRFIKNVGDNSHVGTIWTNSSRENGTNTTAGIDSRTYLDSTTAFTTQFMGLQDSGGIETDGITDNDAYGFYSSLGGGTQPFWWQIDYRDISRGFKPDLGYIPRRDIRGPGSYMRYRQPFADGSFKWISVMSEMDFYENNDHDTTLRDFEESAGVCLRNEIELWYSHGDKYHAPYQNRYDRIRIEHNEEVDIWESISGGFGRGVYEEEPYREYFLDKPQRITDRLVTTFGGNYRIMEADDDSNRNIWLWRWVTEYNFVWDAKVKFTAEQTSEDRHNVTVLFSWPVKPTTDLYVLFNDYETNGEKTTAAFLKLVYRF